MHFIRTTVTDKKYMIDGEDIYPDNIELEFRFVEEGTIENILFRWWNFMWWSVPYQKLMEGKCDFFSGIKHITLLLG